MDRGRITIAGIAQFLMLLWFVLHVFFVPISVTRAQEPITPQNWHEFIADGATVVAQGKYSMIFDYVRAFGPAASGYSYKAASGWGFAVGFDPVQTTQQVVRTTRQVVQQPVPEFTPGWSAYSGAAYWMSRRGGQLPPPSISTWFSSALPMFSGVTTTQWTLKQWTLRTYGGVYGTWQW